MMTSAAVQFSNHGLRRACLGAHSYRMNENGSDVGFEVLRQQEI